MAESVIQIKSGIMINVNLSAKKHCTCEKHNICNPATCDCENGKHLASIIDNSMITCDEIIDAKAKSYDEVKKKTVTTSLMQKMQFVIPKISIFYLYFY